MAFILGVGQGGCMWMKTAAPFLEDDYRQECMKELHRIVNDPLLDGDAIERLTGESQLRPRNVYP